MDGDRAPTLFLWRRPSPPHHSHSRQQDRRSNPRRLSALFIKLQVLDGDGGQRERRLVRVHHAPLRPNPPLRTRTRVPHRKGGNGNLSRESGRMKQIFLLRFGWVGKNQRLRRPVCSARAETNEDLAVVDGLLGGWMDWMEEIRALSLSLFLRASLSSGRRVCQALVQLVNTVIPTTSKLGAPTSWDPCVFELTGGMGTTEVVHA